MTTRLTQRNRPLGVFHDCSVALCGGTHEAFRYWLVDSTQSLPLGSPYLALDNPDWPWFGWPSGALPARCTRGQDHSAPALDCECGFRVMGSLSDLVSALLAEYRLRSGFPDHLAHQKWPTDVFDRIAFGSVAGWGRILHGAGADHAGVLRVENVGVTGPVFLPAGLAAAAAAIEQTYNVTVEVRDHTGLEFVASFLDASRRQRCQGCGTATTTGVGLCKAARLCATAIANDLRAGVLL